MTKNFSQRSKKIAKSHDIVPLQTLNSSKTIWRLNTWSSPLSGFNQKIRPLQNKKQKPNIHSENRKPKQKTRKNLKHKWPQVTHTAQITQHRYHNNREIQDVIDLALGTGQMQATPGQKRARPFSSQCKYAQSPNVKNSKEMIGLHKSTHFRNAGTSVGL